MTKGCEAMPYIMTLLSLFFLDSAIKYLVEKGIIKECTSKKIAIKKYHNKGAMLNMCEKNQQLVAIVSLTFSAFVTGIFAATLGMKGKGLLKAGLSLILGGAYSNTYDRLRRKYVVDYVSFCPDTEKYHNKFLKKIAGKFSGIVFNISDFGIMIGAMLFIIGNM